MGTMKDTSEISELRQQAEKYLGIEPDDTELSSEMSPEKMASLIRELQVHQIELKMQNEELRRIQDALEKTRDKYSHLYDFAPIGYFTVDQKGIIDEANLTVASMLGVERDVLLGQSFTRFVLRDDQDIFYKYRQRLLETETPQPCELRLVKKDGHAFYARLECIVITNKGNDSKQIRVAVNDITGRKEAEALRESEEKYRVLFEVSTHGILITDVGTGQFVDANLSVCQMLGYSKAELLQLGIADIHPRDSLDLVFSDIKLIEQGGKPVGHAIPCLRKDGTVLYADIVGSKTIVHGRRCNVGFFTDTTDRKLAEEALRESEERYRFLVEESNDIIWTFDLSSMTYTYFSNSVERILGYPPEAGRVVTLDNVFSSTTKKQVMSAFSKLLGADSDSTRILLEAEHLCKDGGTVWMEINALLHRDSLNQPVCFTGISRDITDRKRAEEALTESEAFLKTLINAIPIPVFYKDRNGKYLGFNSAFETFVGETKERLIGKSVFDINPPELAEIYHTEDDKLFHGGGIQRYESQWKNAHGELRDIIFNKAVFTDSKGTVTGLLGAITDITERKQAEDALKESEKKFSTLFKTSPVYIASIALDDGYFLDVNDAFTNITGYQRDEVLGRTAVEIGLWFEPEERVKFIKLAQQHGGFHEEEVRFRRKNGEPLFGIWSAEKIELGGKACLISVLVDVTERRKAQEALRQERDKLRIALSEIKTLSGLVPICSNCKKIRDDQGYWNQIEKYIGEHSNAQFSHGICPECAKKLYPDFELYDDEGKLI